MGSSVNSKAIEGEGGVHFTHPIWRGRRSQVLWKRSVKLCKCMYQLHKIAPVWAASGFIALNACFWRARYKAATMSLIRISRFFFTCSLCFFVLMVLTESRASSILTPKKLQFHSTIYVTLWFTVPLNCCDRLARSMNPVVAHGLFSEHESLSKRHGQQNNRWSLVLPASHSLRT